MSILNKIKEEGSIIDFQELIAHIDENFEFTPTKFQNGETSNEAGVNSGSCKLFSYALLNNLSKDQTLKCFGNYYEDVKNTPEANDHQNIRNFMKFGWEGIKFEAQALKKK